MKWNPFRKRAAEQQPPLTSSLPDGHVVAHLGQGGHAEPPPPVGSIAEIEVIGQIAVATLTVTELTQDEGATQLADLLHDMAETGAIYFVLDVHAVQFMDTTCLGCMVQALNDLAARGGKIALANSNQNVDYVFRLTRLDRVFRICADVPAAMAAVEGTDREAG